MAVACRVNVLACVVGALSTSDEANEITTMGTSSSSAGTTKTYVMNHLTPFSLLAYEVLCCSGGGNLEWRTSSHPL